MKVALMMIVGMAAVLTATDVRAQDGQLTTEIRCLAAISLALKAATSPDSRSTLTTMAVHYLGRVEVRDPTLDVAAAMKQTVPYIQSTGAQKVFGGCADSFSAKMTSYAVVLRDAQ